MCLRLQLLAAIYIIKPAAVFCHAVIALEGVEGACCQRLGEFDCVNLAFADILEAPGTNHLIVTHKSMMRAFLCTALALPPTSFRAVDIHNGGVSIFK